MRLLFVGSAYSVHTARWFSQLQGTGWDIHLFDPSNRLVHKELEGITLHTGWKKPDVPAGTTVRCRWPFLRGRHFMERRFPSLWRRILPKAGGRLAELIDRLRPDVVHSLGLHVYSEAVLDAKKYLGGTLPAPWIYSSRGSDIFFYQAFPGQETLIRGVLEACDYYLCNCRRDLRLAKDYGLRGEFLGFFQGGGGYPVREMQKLRAPGLTSARRTLAVKGIQNEIGNALVALEALRICAHLLPGFTIRIFQAGSDAVRSAAGSLAREAGISVDMIPRSPREVIWSLFGESRIVLGVSRSDGIPNTMIEAMIMGAFPIQTNPGKASAEWIDNGSNGLLIPADDPAAIAVAVKTALEDDRKVDAAAEINLERARERIDHAVVGEKVLALYERFTP